MSPEGSIPSTTPPKKARDIINGRKDKKNKMAPLISALLRELDIYIHIHFLPGANQKRKKKGKLELGRISFA